jgi:hypothetical protein
MVGVDLDLHVVVLEFESASSGRPRAHSHRRGGMWIARQGHSQTEATTMSSNTSEPRTRDDLPDGRNGRVVGENDDNMLESIGKAVIAPIEGADEDAEPVDGEHGRAFVDLTKTLPQGQTEVVTPNAPKPEGKAL